MTIEHANVPGAALLEGWSDEGTWRILLPWPEETRTLPWDRAAEWQSFLRDLTCEPATLDGPSPFLGGWVGFLSYEATAMNEAAQPRSDHPPEPAAYFARHRSGMVIDPHGNASFFGVRQPQLPLLDPEAKAAAAAAALQNSLTDGQYANAVDRIRQAIRDGEVYQVNLTRSFSLQHRVDPAALYRALTAPHPPRSSAFLRGDGWSIASASPEVLLRFDRNTGIAESRPIKGTVRRGEGSAETLLASEKDASEHLMIVDVVRNDFGKIAPPGAVSVPSFRTIQTLEHVLHLESTVRATGQHGFELAAVLAALSPAASITGAPKRAAVRMIRDLEPVPRGVYCGSIGYIDARGHAGHSVPIRTAVARDRERLAGDGARRCRTRGRPHRAKRGPCGPPSWSRSRSSRRSPFSPHRHRVSRP